MATALLSLPQIGQHSLTFVCKALGPPVLKWDLSASLDQMAAGRGGLNMPLLYHFAGSVLFNQRGFSCHIGFGINLEYVYVQW
jgi:hypothetical protein